MAIWLFNVQLWTIILGLFILTSAARSADLEILGRQVILTGEIVSGDAERFRKSIEGLSPGTIVRLQSPGGLAREGIAIGRTIRERKFVTYAPYGFCASACGLTWLGGVERWINPNAKVGFHQVYTVDGETNQASGVGNALVGAYMNELGYSEEAIILATVMKPDGMAWLNRELAARVDLDFQEGAPPPGRNAQIQGEVATPKTVQDKLDRAFQLRQDGNFIESANLFLNLAEQGNAVAQTQLGLCYFNGMGVPQNDNEATKWFSFAAAQGEPTGQLMYGIAFQNGWGVRQDDAMGIEWITKAAEQGLSSAQVHLAEIYSRFSGNPTAAMIWSRRAAEQGNPEAQAQLSRLYRRGKGVGKDHIMALMWYDIALSNGFDFYDFEPRTDITNEMTPAQITEAGRRVRGCIASKYQACEFAPFEETVSNSTIGTNPARTNLTQYEKLAISLIERHFEQSSSTKLFEAQILLNQLSSGPDLVTDGTWGAKTEQAVSEVLSLYTAIGGNGPNWGVNELSDVPRFLGWIAQAAYATYNPGTVEFPD